MAAAAAARVGGGQRERVLTESSARTSSPSVWNRRKKDHRGALGTETKCRPAPLLMNSNDPLVWEGTPAALGGYAVASVAFRRCAVAVRRPDGKPPLQLAAAAYAGSFSPSAHVFYAGKVSTSGHTNARNPGLSSRIVGEGGGG